MKIASVGTDIIECVRIGQMIEQHGESFLRKMFHDVRDRILQALEPWPRNTTPPVGPPRTPSAKRTGTQIHAWAQLARF